MDVLSLRDENGLGGPEWTEEKKEVKREDEMLVPREAENRGAQDIGVQTESNSNEPFWRHPFDAERLALQKRLEDEFTKEYPNL